MARKLLAPLALLAALVALPLAAAENHTEPNTPTIDINVNDDDSPDESTFAGMSTTVVIVLIVLAVLVVALIVAMASRP